LNGVAMEILAQRLSLVIFLPLVGGLALLCLPRQRRRELFAMALVFSLAAFLLSLKILWEFDSTAGALQFVERRPWIPSYGIQYFVGIDGLSLFLFLLTTFLGPIVILASWTTRERVKEYLFFMLALETGMLGAFAALDLFLFYVFWEVMLVPMYFLIGVWGGPRRTYAAVKFVVYTMSGSLLMLVAIIYLAAQNFEATQLLTFDLFELYDLNLPDKVQLWLFLAFALSFAIKVPLFPFHTWLPDAHVEAPTAGSVILAGILLKMGTYGFLRFAIPLFPDAALAAAPYIVALSVVGIVYGALVAMMQEDLKRLVAYSSVSHLGFVMLGLFALNLQGLQGALFQMLSHGLSTGALFLAVGMIYERRHTRLISEFGGLWTSVPVFSASFLLIALSSIGLPGLNGFVGEFLILLGTLRDRPLWAAGAASGIVLGAIYMLWMFRRVVFGPLRPENQNLQDVGWREVLILAPILVLIVWMGIYPQPFLSRMRPSIEPVIEKIEAKRQAAALLHAQREPRDARPRGD
jgi:NADH-quinone oxidoreductase subunit M